MAQIQSPETYVDGQQVTAARLNNQTNGAILLPGAVTDQTALAAGTVATGDTLIVHDLSASALRKATANDILNSNIPITTPGITGTTGADLVITPAAGQKVDVAGAIEVESINSVGNSTIGGNATVTGTLGVTGASTLGSASVTSLSIGGKTPMTTEDNLTKSYVKFAAASGATGAGTENLVYQTPVLTVPADETWIYEFWVKTTSGNVNGNTRPDFGSVSLRVYNNATLLETLKGSTSPYGGHTATFTGIKTYTSADVGARLILKTYNWWGLNEEPIYHIRLTKVKTSTLSDSASCI